MDGGGGDGASSGGAPPTDAGLSDGGTTPCTGVVCNMPPATVCSGNDVQVSEAVGTCGPTGECSYASSTLPCPNGCSNGSCIGDPCIGVTCNAPPANTCADANNLTVYQPSGTCDSSGACSYSNVLAFCPFGCQSDVCVGDPCVGVSCNMPPPSFCKDADNLKVFDAPGICGSGGLCSYPTTRDVFCAFGCSGTQCTNDPCAGKVCTTPPADNCKDANTARSYPSTGVCVSGLCTYPETEISCPFGCVNGVCQECNVDANCPAGEFCQNSTCVPCDTSDHCGPSCTDCTATGDVCDAGVCVECVGSGLCSPGQYCGSNVCLPCTTNARCGATCVACGSGTNCDGTGCIDCDTNAMCGPSCTPCGGSTPHCQAAGPTSVCVECLTDGHCVVAGETCNMATGQCQPPCPPTLTSAFGDNFSAPSSSSWTTGSDTPVTTSSWRVYTTANHGVRINGGRLEITNETGSSGGHGHGYAYIVTDGAGSAYDNQLYSSTLKSNAGKSVVWTLNMRRNNPESTNGGFDCSSTGSQNGRTLGLAYVIATDSSGGLNSSAGTCSSSASGKGYAVVLGGSRQIRLVRFSGGLRNGAIVDLVASGNFSSVSRYFSARVTYDATNDQWTLEARDDGSSSFSDPATGSYSFTGMASDATYVNEPLSYAGPYFQGGCCCMCSAEHNAFFDNVGVGVRCAP